MNRDVSNVTNRKRGLRSLRKVRELSSASEEDGWLSLVCRGLVAGVARSLTEKKRKCKRELCRQWKDEKERWLLCGTDLRGERDWRFMVNIFYEWNFIVNNIFIKEFYSKRGFYEWNFIVLCQAVLAICNWDLDSRSWRILQIGDLSEECAFTFACR